jgi:hypothetical protein
MEYTSTTCHFAPVFPYRPELRRKRPQVPQPPRGFPPIESDWVVEFETFLSSDQKATLYSHLFRPVNLQGPRAHKALVVLHGQGEHSGRYIHWPHFLRDTVGSIYAISMSMPRTLAMRSVAMHRIFASNTGAPKFTSPLIAWVG